ncbi:ferredoxin [Pseudarthrobacter phenanthrenivorans]|jgi:ferredoxin|uniref:Oxidoreductase n=1 Tax=Pseudarthrobacter phenanthrenivorans TaxID=361575 RepID=A0A0B4DIB2_PSEPS|nr:MULTISPECIES: ferredoxin [Micrococcaceae]KIC66446.1 oxidoreductase [Pseudarthrobacter phenanthrenivorans]MDJ0459763.1 ferredoxin [Arthrobacter sp. NQ7]
MTTHLHIDWTSCDGRGLCAELLPGILDRDDWGYPVARGKTGHDRTDVPLREADREAAREAVRLCPKLALGLVERTPPEAERRRPGR